MRTEEFLLGHLVGFGCVQGLSGKVLRRYTVEITGVWSAEHRAMHVDETYTYLDQPGAFHRNWAIHSDEQGHIVGHDAVQAARFRGQADGEDVRAVFDRPIRPGGRLEPKQVVRFIRIGPSRFLMIGRMKLLGLTIATTHTALTKVS